MSIQSTYKVTVHYRNGKSTYCEVKTTDSFSAAKATWHCIAKHVLHDLFLIEVEPPFSQANIRMFDNHDFAQF